LKSYPFSYFDALRGTRRFIRLFIKNILNYKLRNLHHENIRKKLKLYITIKYLKATGEQKDGD